MFMRGKKKIKICDIDGGKLDVATISNEQDAKDLIKRWKLKGLF
jgi:hypothetical protein